MLVRKKKGGQGIISQGGESLNITEGKKIGFSVLRFFHGHHILMRVFKAQGN
jgi:hypothetical protein